MNNQTAKQNEKAYFEQRNRLMRLPNNMQPFLHHPLGASAAIAVDYFELIVPAKGDFIFCCPVCVQRHLDKRWKRTFFYTGATRFDELNLEAPKCFVCNKCCFKRMNENLIHDYGGAPGGAFTGSLYRTNSKL